MRGYMRRMGAYFAEMFPLPTHLAVAALIYGSVASFARVIHDVPRLCCRGTRLSECGVISPSH